eukprot:Pgem_evm1s20130
MVNAVGREKVLNNVASNINLFLNDASRNWECLIVVFADEEKLPAEKLEVIPEKCSIFRSVGSGWGSNLLLLDPKILEFLFDYIFILLDDLFLLQNGPNAVDLTKAVLKMQTYNIDIFSPRVYGSTYEHMYSDLHKDGSDCLHEVQVLEIFATIYTMEMWRCMYHYFEPQNEGGWCYDRCASEFCPGALQVVDKKYATPFTGKDVAKPLKTENKGSFDICRKFNCNI